jgi:lysophospholipase L1-like esterase
LLKADLVVSDAWLPVIQERQTIVRKIAEDFNAHFIPCQRVFDKALQKAPAAYWLSDGVHPTLAGHELMADAWIEAVTG